MLEKNMALLHPELFNSDLFVGASFPVPFLLTTCAFCSSLPAFVFDIRADFDKRFRLLLGLWWTTGVHVD